jgi:beta-D-xylosidase 4
MCSYNSVCLDCDPDIINGTGIPSCANSALQNDMVRGDWAWDGFFVSDCDAIGNIFSPHNFAPTAQGAAVAGILGGTDVDCGTTYSKNLVQAVAEGQLTQDALRASATRMLTVGFGLSLFDPVGSTLYDAIPPTHLDSADNRALALEGAIQGIVLLQNNATASGPLLPLRLKDVGKLAIIGPLANATQTLLSNYEGGNTLVNSHSILQVLSARAAAEGAGVTYAPGCVNATGGATVWCQDTLGFPAAVAAANAADVVVAVVGLCSVCEEGWRVEGEAHDRHVLTLPGQQEALVQALAATGKPVILVLVHGGPLAIEALRDTMPAILDAHYPGEMGGDAVTAVLLGDASPSGRLSSTVYPADYVTRRPITDMALAPHGDSPGITHLFFPESEALWPFGWGLSYTTFQFVWFDSAGGGAQEASTAGFAASPPYYACNVTNTGTVASDVSILGMFSSGIPSEPIQELFDFDRVAQLQPGETRTVYLTLPAGIAAIVTDAGDRVLVPGEYVVRVGEPRNWAVGSLRLTGPPTLVTPRQAA